jgi:hypothetical protein
MSVQSQANYHDLTHVSHDQVEFAKQQDAERWLQKSRETQDPHAALDYAQRALDFMPHHPEVHASVRRGVLERLWNDAFVAFLAETDTNYVIRFRESRPIAVPKVRAPAEIFPPAQKSEGERVLGMTGWMMAGLILCGLGTLVLSPFVIGRAVGVLTQGNIPVRDQRQAWLAIFLAIALSIPALLFAFLLVLHIIG